MYRHLCLVPSFWGAPKLVLEIQTSDDIPVANGYATEIAQRKEITTVFCRLLQIMIMAENGIVLVLQISAVTVFNSFHKALGFIKSVQSEVRCRAELDQVNKKERNCTDS